MGWNDPSYDELLDDYSASKKQYENAAYNWNSQNKKYSEYTSQRKQLNSQLDSIKSANLNFEKRLEGVKKIIGNLDGSGGGFFKVSVPDTISKATKSLEAASDSFKSCIRHSGLLSASLRDVFAVKGVPMESHSATALDLYRSEKARLEQAIEENKKQIAAMSDQISALTKQINACSSEINAYRRTMNSSADDMARIQKALNSFD